MRLFQLSEIFLVSHARLHVLAGVAGLGVQEEYDQDETSSLVILLHLDEWLGRSVSQDPDTRLLLLQQLWPDAAAHLLVLEKFLRSGTANLPHFRIGVADQQFCTWPTSRWHPLFLDVKTGERLDNLAMPPLELWSLDLNALKIRSARALQERTKNLAQQG